MSDEWRERVIELSGQGMRQFRIAATLGVSKGKVAGVLYVRKTRKRKPRPKAPEPPWREKARRMHAEGRYTYRQIGEACGVHMKTVERFVSMDRGFTPTISTGVQSSITEEALTEHHTPRSIRTFLKPDRMPAARRFAAGEITRAELMLAIAA